MSTTFYNFMRHKRGPISPVDRALVFIRVYGRLKESFNGEGTKTVISLSDVIVDPVSHQIPEVIKQLDK
jgi:hypothetical protein